MLQVPLRLVLVRPQNPDNVGAIARVMKNFGVRDWVFVAPEFGDVDAARKLAVHAGDLLTTARTVESLDEAVHDCVWVLGTSSRQVRGKRRFGPREAAQEMVERSAHGPVALVLGGERSGLSNEDVDRCHDLSAIAAEEEQPSLNLAQAALLYLYEVHEAARAARPPPPPPEAVLATDEELMGVAGALERMLGSAGFLQADSVRAVRELMSPLRRSKLRRREAGMWRSALEAVGKALGRRDAAPR